jgi:FkbM family methyltransferase
MNYKELDRLRVRISADENNHYIEEALGKIYDLLEGFDNICVFGMGAFGITMLPPLQERLGKRLTCVSDNERTKWYRLFNGLRCIPPAELPGQRDKICLVVSIFDSDSVVMDLKQRGFKNIVEIPEKGLVNVCVRSKLAQKLYHGNWDKIQQAFFLLQDEQSQAVLLHRLHFIVFPQDFAGSDRPMEAVYTGNQYFPEGIIHLADNEAFVDGGAYVGDTIKDFIRRAGSFDKIHSFEPENDNYIKLRNYVGNLTPEINNKINIYKLGLWDRPTMLTISGSTCGTYVSRSGSSESYAKLDALDNILGEDAPVSYIKLDVEGSERNALLGAYEIIRSRHPRLAVCVYHKLEDIYELPLLIHELNPGYKLYLRHHHLDSNAYETVCYAI